MSNYGKAYTEVLDIIKYLPDEEQNKIPNEKIEFFKENCDKDYKFEFDPSKPLEEQELLKETYALFITLFRDYFATESQKEKLKEILIINEEKKQKEAKEKYNPYKILEERNKKIEPKQNLELVEVQEGNTIKKIFNKIINMIRKLKK